MGYKIRRKKKYNNNSTLNLIIKIINVTTNIFCFLIAQLTLKHHYIYESNT